MKAHIYFAMSAMFLIASIGCSKKTMSDRDVRREQLRINAHKKRQELTPLTGNFRGQMIDAGGYKQDVSMHLEIKDVPETEGGKIDPVLVPTLNGSLNVSFGSGSGIELFSFGTTKADFNATDFSLDMVVANTQFKDINLSLKRFDKELRGSWSSPTASVSGIIELEEVDALNLGGGTDAIKGLYSGFLEWKQAPYFASGLLTLSTGQDGVDSFHVTANLKIVIASESYFYEFDAVEFNPFTRQLSLRSEKSEIYFVGEIGDGAIHGNWFSVRSGLLGSAQFSTAELSVPERKSETPAASGTWFTTVTNVAPTAQLPSRLMLSFNAVPDQSKNGGLALTGSARFFEGSYASDEYYTYNFESVDYQPFSRRVVVVTQGVPKLTIQIDLDTSGISGSIEDVSLGKVAIFSGSHQRPNDGAK